MKNISVFLKNKNLTQYFCLSCGTILFLHVIISFSVTNNQTINVNNIFSKSNREGRGIASIPKNINIPGVEEKLEQIKEVLEKKEKEK